MHDMNVFEARQSPRFELLVSCPRLWLCWKSWLDAYCIAHGLTANQSHSQAAIEPTELSSSADQIETVSRLLHIWKRHFSSGAAPPNADWQRRLNDVS